VSRRMLTLRLNLFVKHSTQIPPNALLHKDFSRIGYFTLMFHARASPKTGMIPHTKHKLPSG
jgi:hypothetical protein